MGILKTVNPILFMVRVKTTDRKGSEKENDRENGEEGGAAKERHRNYAHGQKKRRTNIKC